MRYGTGHATTPLILRLFGSKTTHCMPSYMESSTKMNNRQTLIYSHSEETKDGSGGLLARLKRSGAQCTETWEKRLITTTPAIIKAIPNMAGTSSRCPRNKVAEMAIRTTPTPDQIA